MRKTILMIALCLAGALLNIVLNRLDLLAGLPLFLDTVLTVALTFYGGLFWGALCGVLTHLIHYLIWFAGWEMSLYTLCSIATAVLTWLFIRFFPRELDLFSRHARYEQLLRTAGIERRSGSFAKLMDRAIVLTLLSFALCLVMSVMGGLITALILKINASLHGQRALGGILSDTMFSKNIPMPVVEIAARIPINIIDRLVAAFGGYAIALGLKKLTVGTRSVTGNPYSGIGAIGPLDR